MDWFRTIRSYGHAIVAALVSFLEMAVLAPLKDSALLVGPSRPKIESYQKGKPDMQGFVLLRKPDPWVRLLGS